MLTFHSYVAVYQRVIIFDRSMFQNMVFICLYFDQSPGNVGVDPTISIHVLVEEFVIPPETALSNFTHLLVYASSPLAEQTTPASSSAKQRTCSAGRSWGVVLPQ